MRRVQIASATGLAAEAGAAVADAGGNAVDAAIGASIASMCTEIGIIAPAGSGFVTVWPRDGEPIVIDGYAYERDYEGHYFAGGEAILEVPRDSRDRFQGFVVGDERHSSPALRIAVDRDLVIRAVFSP